MSRALLASAVAVLSLAAIGTAIELSASAVDAPDAGVEGFNVYVRGDGYVAIDSLADGGHAERALAHSPCAMRPVGVDPALCGRVALDGGLIDFGELNVMQPGDWKGPGCVEAPCAIMAGERSP